MDFAELEQAMESMGVTGQSDTVYVGVSLHITYEYVMSDTNESRHI